MLYVWVRKELVVCRALFSKIGNPDSGEHQSTTICYEP
jgi:hypothetical protein